MNISDEAAFGVTFLKLRNVFNMRGDTADVRQAMGAYFKVLRHHTLRLVEVGAENWMARGTRFPKPAEWVDAIPRQVGAGLLVLPEDEASTYLRALSLSWEDEPCGCHVCTRAGVSHRMLRYVPDTDDDDRDVRMLIGDKVVVRGHWAHGDELRRWYVARDGYLALKAQFIAEDKLIKSMPKVTRGQIAREEQG